MVLGGVSNMSVVVGWNMISSVFHCAVLLCLWLILVSAVSTIFAVQVANFRWEASTWNEFLWTVTAVLLFIGFFVVIVLNGAVYTVSLRSTMMSSGAGTVTCYFLFLLGFSCF